MTRMLKKPVYTLYIFLSPARVSPVPYFALIIPNRKSTYKYKEKKTYNRKYARVLLQNHEMYTPIVFRMLNKERGTFSIREGM